MDEFGDLKRLFFGFEVHAPWPDNLPDSRSLKAKHRHLTLVFLGNTSYKKIRSLIPQLPKPSFRVGAFGICDSSLFLPHRDPKVVTWHVEPFGEDVLASYQKELSEFLEGEGYPIDKRKFLKHITLGRSPFKKSEWKKHFRPLPVYFHHLHLYESSQGLVYEPIWSHDLLPPFEKVKSGSQVIFKLYGETLQKMICSAQIALCFEHPELTPYLNADFELSHLEEGEKMLNQMLENGSKEVNISFKKVRFEGEMTPYKDVNALELHCAL